MGAFGADGNYEPSKGGAAGYWSPEVTRTTMAHGGAVPNHGELRKTTMPSNLEHGREGKRDHGMRLLTTSVLEGSTGSKRA